MKNKDFFYQQYEKINWEKQEELKLNYFINDFIISEIISKNDGPVIKIFDIGFGNGFFIKMLKKIKGNYSKILISGCEPSIKNYTYFNKKLINFNKNFEVAELANSSFLSVKSTEKFDFITALYVFPHFVSFELEKSVKKIYNMLEKNGQFILVVANENYINKKLKLMKDLIIERNIITFNSKKYFEVLHYSEIPKIGKIIDYNREERFYVDLFTNSGFNLKIKKDLDDNGFICTIFVFQKK